jgi:quercetin dioxygenase-like cupin family protein
MKVVHWNDVAPEPVSTEGARGVTIRRLLTAEDGAPRFIMRQFTVEVGGHTPLHEHDFEHEVFVLEGQGAVWRDGAEVPLSPGTAVFVPGGEKHRFLNKGTGLFRFLCLVPA